MFKEIAYSLINLGLIGPRILINLLNTLLLQPYFKVQLQNAPILESSRPLTHALANQPTWMSVTDDALVKRRFKRTILSVNPLYKQDTLHVQNYLGKSKPIGSLIEGKAVVIVLGNLGSAFTQDYLRILSEAQEEILNQKFEIIILSLGKSEEIKNICDIYQLDKDCLYVNPQKDIYKLMELDLDFMGLYFLQELGDFDFRHLYTTLQYYHPLMPLRFSDMFQEGAIIISDGPKVIYATEDSLVGNHVKLQDVIKVCRRYTKQNNKSSFERKRYKLV